MARRTSAEREPPGGSGVARQLYMYVLMCVIQHVKIDRGHPLKRQAGRRASTCPERWENSILRDKNEARCMEKVRRKLDGTENYKLCK